MIADNGGLRRAAPAPHRRKPPAMTSPAHEILQRVFGYPAFRGHQEDVVEHVANGGDALVLMPTGGGKSLCFQIPALLRPASASSSRR
jgi:ATP-dependent DNA helicase RecQ